jgi:LuxR family maltose regulon positive regulatory protein
LRPAQDAWASSKQSLRPAPEFVYALYILLSEIFLLLNQRDHYASTLKEVKEYIFATSSQYLLKNLSAYEAKTAISNGDKAAAEEWLKNYYVNENSFKEFYKIYRNFTTARAYIILMQTDKAWDALNKLRILSESYDRPLDKAEADVLLSIVEWITGKRKEAQNRLLGVLSAMQEYGFVRVIANEGRAVLPILSSVIKKIESDNELSNQLHRFAKEVYILSYETSKLFKGITYKSEAVSIRLSSRQKHILELLAQGHKNSEIVGITGLSLNTIRTHTKAVYQKLEVNSAKDAILQAKKLGILE